MIPRYHDRRSHSLPLVQLGQRHERRNGYDRRQRVATCYEGDMPCAR